jgi:PadR family transcriptional regulator, regulatory protein PadR
MVEDVRMTFQTAAILAVLLTKPWQPRYGLEIATEARLQRGTLYPALARLERAGWIASEWEDIDEAAEGRRRRRYYQLTGEGVVAAQQALEAARKRLTPNPFPMPGPAGMPP